MIEKYGNGMDPVGAGTVSFKSLMNLFMVMSELDGDLTPKSITDELQAQVDAPSFAGHPYTCDGQQFDGPDRRCAHLSRSWRR